MTFRFLVSALNIKLSFISVLALLISACGGGTGFTPTITGVIAQVFQYGKTATIYLGGKDLRSNIQIESNGGCINPSFAPSSSTELLVLNCTVNVVGDVQFTFKTEAGKEIYTILLYVPKPQVSILTSEGDIVLELDPLAAPVSVNNFLNYANSGFYQSTLFHRVISDFVIQGGGYMTGMVKKNGHNAPIVLESNNGLSNLRGTVAMARTNELNSATSEFFINVVDNLYLDYSASSPGYAVFGKVVQGMYVIDAIAAKTTGKLNDSSDVPMVDITITKVLQIK